MELFFELEIVYLIIGAFIMTVTAVVTTRDFMPKVAFKRGMLLVGGFLTIMISFHHYMTVTRMAGVKEIFNEGQTIICENKMRRTVSRSVLLSQDMGWTLKGDEFINPAYERNFHTSRCIEFDGIVPK